jgi:hypothetical protein
VLDDPGEHDGDEKVDVEPFQHDVEMLRHRHFCANGIRVEALRDGVEVEAGPVEDLDEHDGHEHVEHP